MKEEGIVDIFSSELKKSELKKEKKLNKLKQKELKKQEKLSKKLSKKEDREFAKMQIKKEKKEIEVLTPTPLKFLYDTMFGFFLILILLISICYNVYYFLKDELNIINGILLFVLSLNFIISMTIKKENPKKFFAILTVISMSLFIGYQFMI